MMMHLCYDLAEVEWCALALFLRKFPRSDYHYCLNFEMMKARAFAAVLEKLVEMANGMALVAACVLV